MRMILAVALTAFLVWPASAQEPDYSHHDWEIDHYGYAFMASERCRGVQRLFEPQAADLASRVFQRGQRRFEIAIINRSLSWACGAALNLYDGSKKLGKTILRKKGLGAECRMYRDKDGIPCENICSRQCGK